MNDLPPKSFQVRKTPPPFYIDHYLLDLITFILSYVNNIQVVDVSGWLCDFKLLASFIVSCEAGQSATMQ